MGFAGRLEGIAPSDIFQVISQSRMTGTLIARFQDGTAMVVFKNGQVIEAASDAPEESLGNLLVSQGFMTMEAVEAARERQQQEPGLTLGAALVRMGALSEQTLDAVVRKQIGSVVHRLVACEDGFFTFDSGENALKRKLNTREFFLPSGVSAEFLMMERAREIDEDRRTGRDRRSAPRPPATETWNGEERRKPAAPAPAVGAGLQRFFGSLGQKAAGFAAAAGRFVSVSVLPWFRSAWGRVRAFSPEGKELIIAGVVAILAGGALILFASLTSRTQAGDITITGRIVNVRATPATDGKIIARVSRGETLALVSSKEGWHEVRTKAGGSGWVSERVAERKETVRPVNGYAVAGSGIVLALGLALLITGVVRKRRNEASAPGLSREAG